MDFNRLRLQATASPCKKKKNKQISIAIIGQKQDLTKTPEWNTQACRPLRLAVWNSP